MILSKWGVRPSTVDCAKLSSIDLGWSPSTTRSTAARIRRYAPAATPIRSLCRSAFGGRPAAECRLYHVAQRHQFRSAPRSGCCCLSRSLVRIVHRLWSMRQFRPRLPHQLDCLPARDHCGGSDPSKRGGEVVNFGMHHLPLAGAAPAAKKWGSLPLPSPVSCGAPGEAGTREAKPRFASSQWTREIPVVPPLMWLSRQSLHHTGQGSALCREKPCGCQMHVTL